MGGLRSRSWWLAVAIFAVWSISACGGHKPGGVSPFAAKVTLNPGGNLSVQLGGFLNFTAAATNSTNNSVNATFSFTSSDPSILNIAPNGVACAGHFDAAFTTCTPGNTGMVLVTASTLGSTSAPTFVFVHPPIDNIIVEGVLLNGLPIQEPCLPQSQTMTVEAHAYSQGSDITASVGTFAWSANNANVVKITPLQTTFVYNNTTYFIATNRATVTAVNPGITRIYATASSVFSTTFKQPDLVKPAPITFDFFETCPIQNITLGLGPAGSQQNSQTSFVTSKGTSQNVTAVLTDVLGNSSLPNLNGQVVLSKIPLTWTASQPGVVAASTNCTQSCSVSTPSPGAGSVTASCSPPTCNIGFPEVPPALSPASLATCASYIKSQFPAITSCEEFIPAPVYATIPITGIVTGATSAATVLASSVDCQNEPPLTCTTGMYSISTGKASAGNANSIPSVPNSLLFDLVGDKAYVGSQFGALSLNPANLNTNNAAFSLLGAVTGKVIAVSPNGATAIFSDTDHIPNQVFVVGPGAPIALNVSGATAAAFSHDGLKAYIFAFDSNQNPTLYVYSTLQALQAIPLPANTTVDSIVFSDNGAFAYVVEPNLGGIGPAVSVYNTCNNQIATGKNSLNQIVPQIIPLPAAPIVFKTLQDGVHFVAMEGSGNIDYISATVTGITAATPTVPATYICPMNVSHSVQTINLQQGPIHPINVFASADGTQLYVAASDRSSILVYNFGTGAVSGILLNGNATPVSADITVDSGTIMVGGNDGKLHEVSTAIGGSDLVQVQFPFLPGYLNPFCTFNPSTGPCTFDLMAVKP
jgi:hypothetical protein